MKTSLDFNGLSWPSKIFKIFKEPEDDLSDGLKTFGFKFRQFNWQICVKKIFLNPFKSRFLIKTGAARTGRTDYPTAGCFFWFICFDCSRSFKWFINYSFVKGFINIWISTKIDQIFIVCWYPIALIKFLTLIRKFQKHFQKI